MKSIFTNDIQEAIYPFEKAREISERSYWGEDLNDPCIDGALAMKQAAERNMVISTGNTLQKGVGYIFHFNKAGTKLQPYHVTMLPKTAANIEKGSQKYGSLSISAELNY